ncbi:CoB--CoM heterodisulfide reductase iron-sulfur subunit B family protein [bacterium]|nr:CoB--CoM heterodisulfide reductase iron-sulfur subunit B family protein [bacterium]
MKFLYFPGCSLDGTALEYNQSTRVLMKELGVELYEIPDWTCCGASAAEATSTLLSFVLPARTLALAERMDASDEILVPCSACYLNLTKTAKEAAKDPELLEKINRVLEIEGLRFHNRLKIRHLLDVLAVSIGADTIQSLVTRPLSNIRVAPYYGCQCIRPYAVFDDPEDPHSMEPLIKATGAQVHTWGMGGTCCGASHINLKPEISIELVTSILREAKPADVTVTVCPMCQINLEANQQKISKRQHEDLNVSILYLPQLLGLAMKIPRSDLRLDLNLSVTKKFRLKLEMLDKGRVPKIHAS